VTTEQLTRVSELASKLDQSCYNPEHPDWAINTAERYELSKAVQELVADATPS
jgi:hypothetical protein